MKEFDKSNRPVTKSAGCTFEEWKRRVDASVYAQVGVSADDLPDWDYYQAYDDDLRPSIAATRAIHAAELF